MEKNKKNLIEKEGAHKHETSKGFKLPEAHAKQPIPHVRQPKKGK